ncbi:2,3-dihydroxybenzoate decarboxylase [Psilocybe cubensis]|uniref:2,3-dihydroxybenzoate decarboxylase n=1 Tax=Psilocybe cubensis TaxID=181762 RepID=A0ACB8GP45_PSICU|nr:2,3-dihydroxybenzoate decarboxylase [Psilocybe cubensis]KAH9477187.1 2,3-dihydroxybenzoate decarboxylase [Psilocybe cubensis]
MAVQVNDQLAATISNATDRFGAFASLAMHNATNAALELKRTPEYDVFWQMVSDLDVPVYFHPRTSIQTILNLSFSHAPFLIGPAQEFAVGLSTHILGLCTNGVFDRFPKLKIIVGHMGERIPSDLVRIDTQLKREIPFGLMMKQNVTTYFRKNIFETTSGNFAPDLLNFHIGQIGLDRIMYSIDYPFVNIPDGTAFINALSRTMIPEDHNSLARGLAIKVLRLDD